jgi:hypothetical protein
MATKVIFNEVKPFIDTCSTLGATGIEWEWFKLWAANIGLTSYTIECKELADDAFISYVNSQSNSIGLGGLFFKDDYYLNYKTLAPVIQSQLEIGIATSNSLSGKSWSVLMSMDLVIMFIFMIMLCGVVFWYTEEYSQRMFRGLARRTSNFHEITHSMYRMF